MRTTLDIPEELLQEVTDLLQFKSKTDAVIVALRELIRRRRLEELKALAGHLPLNVDIDASRRRPARGQVSVSAPSRSAIAGADASLPGPCRPARSARAVRRE
jgi:Arc/MetJ family transcription regulator